MRIFVNKTHITLHFSNYNFFLINNHNYCFLTVKFVNAFVMCHLEMEPKQNEEMSNSVRTDWKCNDFSKVHRKINTDKLVSLYDALNKSPTGWLCYSSFSCISQVIVVWLPDLFISSIITITCEVDKLLMQELVWRMCSNFLNEPFTKPYDWQHPGHVVIFCRKFMYWWHLFLQ